MEKKKKNQEKKEPKKQKVGDFFEKSALSAPKG
jgi:hypothetical protein